MKLSDYYFEDEKSLCMTKFPAINTIIKEIKNYPDLERIHFKDRTLNFEQMNELMKGITCADNPNLTSVHFRSCLVGNEELKVFIKYLPRLKSVKELSFENNLLDDSVMYAFGRALQGSSVKFLSLSSNPITDRGIEEFIRCIPRSKIEVLDLCCLLINNDTIEALCDIIMQSQLTHITIDGCAGSNDYSSKVDPDLVYEMKNLLEQNKKKIMLPKS